MDRTIINPLEQMRDFDYVEGNHDILLALAYTTRDTLNTTNAVVSGCSAAQTTVPSLSINVAAGRIYQQAPADATAVGSIPQDLTVITQQGLYAGGTLTFIPPSTGGQSQWNLVQGQFSQVDAVRADDPTGGNVAFYNSADPTVPNVESIDTVREGLLIIQVVQGTAATTGSEAPPNPTAGWIPLYLIDLVNGQTAITNGQILVAGPSVGTNVPSNYPYAPFLGGLLQQHHTGRGNGQAPRIQLTNAEEVQGVLPAANMASVGPRNMAVYKIIGGTQQVSINGAAFTTTGATAFPAPASGVAKVRTWGAGGGAGGTNSAGSIGGSGGGGEYAEGIFTGLTTSTTITVGAPGTAGDSSPTGGGTGGTSSFGALMTALGGGGGGAQSGGGAGAGGPAGTGGAGGTFRVAGCAGSVGTSISTTSLGSWPGTSFGTGSVWEIGGTVSPANGQPASFPGGGGGAGLNGGTSEPGASGCIIVEY